MASDALEPSHLMGHIKDADHFLVPEALSPQGDGYIHIPQLLKPDEPILEVKTGNPGLDTAIEPLDLKLTKFMILEVVVAILMAVIFIRMAALMSSGRLVKGRLANLFESFLLFIRDSVARPAIGRHDGDRFLPFLWTVFFFILGCNLMGLIPWMGSPTGALAVTGMLALITFCTVVVAGMRKLGPVGFLAAQVPHMDLPWVLAIFLKPMIFGIEIMGLLIKHFILAIRLFANMMAGHLVLGVILAFIGASYGSLVWWGVMPASVFGATALSLLELLVAFIQAYIFTYLSALFIGMAVHPH